MLNGGYPNEHTMTASHQPFARWMIFGAVGLLLGVAGCGRNLSLAEDAYLTGLLGPTLDTSAIRVSSTGGIRAVTDAPPKLMVPRQALNCQVPADTRAVRPPTAIALFDTIWVSPVLHYENLMVDWPERIPLARAILLAHEATHVWQWQNRDITGYSPYAAMMENVRSRDPYSYELEPGKGFLEYGFEQQGRIVGDFVCETAADPHSERTAALRALLVPVFGPGASLTGRN